MLDATNAKDKELRDFLESHYVPSDKIIEKVLPKLNEYRSEWRKQNVPSKDEIIFRSRWTANYHKMLLENLKDLHPHYQQRMLLDRRVVQLLMEHEEAWFFFYLRKYVDHQFIIDSGLIYFVYHVHKNEEIKARIYGYSDSWKKD